MQLDLTAAARTVAERDLGPGEAIRIAFAGGCGAMGFRLAATRRRNDGDLELDLDGVTVRLDRRAAKELDGGALDWNEEDGFFVDHPEWGVTC